ncbi:hypothetical protein EDC01DRAFT_656880 [Geopyxis carbonaria]|nr:hypothetical protein EDC01DRAFT_656880 [Geopyxis carbonaria]
MRPPRVLLETRRHRRRRLPRLVYQSHQHRPQHHHHHHHFHTHLQVPHYSQPQLYGHYQHHHHHHHHHGHTHPIHHQACHQLCLHTQTHHHHHHHHNPAGPAAQQSQPSSPNSVPSPCTVSAPSKACSRSVTTLRMRSRRRSSRRRSSQRTILSTCMRWRERAWIGAVCYAGCGGCWSGWYWRRRGGPWCDVGDEAGLGKSTFCGFE